MALVVEHITRLPLELRITKEDFEYHVEYFHSGIWKTVKPNSQSRGFAELIWAKNFTNRLVSKVYGID